MEPQQFGNYTLLERISHGGMAEVFRAKSVGEAGVEREVALKVLLPSMASDQEFVTMLIDEAKIAGQLNHANIAQIYDLGVNEDRYYIVQEYVNGRDLRTILRHKAQTHARLDVATACHISQKICEGLHYAHNKTDAYGRPLNLVHRDISPHNILISSEGEIKIIDFGIAKAEGRSTETASGMVKGKFAYMSPEQIRGLPVDHRSDVFATGILLHEMLTNRPLFRGASEFETLKRARAALAPPPSRLNPEVPSSLDRIVLKALARHVDDRYQSALELRDALWAFARDYNAFSARPELNPGPAGPLTSSFEVDLASEIHIINQHSSAIERTPSPFDEPVAAEISLAEIESLEDEDDIPAVGKAFGLAHNEVDALDAEEDEATVFSPNLGISDDDAHYNGLVDDPFASGQAPNNDASEAPTVGAYKPRLRAYPAKASTSGDDFDDALPPATVVDPRFGLSSEAVDNTAEDEPLNGRDDDDWAAALGQGPSPFAMPGRALEDSATVVGGDYTPVDDRSKVRDGHGDDISTAGGDDVGGEEDETTSNRSQPRSPMAYRAPADLVLDDTTTEGPSRRWKPKPPLTADEVDQDSSAGRHRAPSKVLPHAAEYAPSEHLTISDNRLKIQMASTEPVSAAALLQRPRFNDPRKSTQAFAKTVPADAVTDSQEAAIMAVKASPDSSAAPPPESMSPSPVPLPYATGPAPQTSPGAATQAPPMPSLPATGAFIAQTSGKKLSSNAEAPVSLPTPKRGSAQTTSSRKPLFSFAAAKTYWVMSALFLLVLALAATLTLVVTS